MQLFKDLQESLLKNSDRNAFYINDQFYTYADFAQSVSNIRKAVQKHISTSEKIVGIVANDDIETYAAIVALWFEGKAYVPLSTETPKDRNDNVIAQAGINNILDSSPNPFFKDNTTISTKELNKAEINIKHTDCSEGELAYILFTSGTTGVPKGVPITRANLGGIIRALEDMQLEINPEDRCLQMSELTFDVSITSFLYPLLKGACVYTIPKGRIKFSYAYQLMDEQKLTVVQLVPSLLNYLRKYFDEILLPDVKYSLLTAEALPLDLANDWKRCVPNAKIINLYGPTENTVWSTYYVYNKEGNNKSYNGMLSIGKAMYGTETIIVDEDKKILNTGEKGELCLCGVQLTPGYWNNEEKNNESFFEIKTGNEVKRFYKSGDLCSMDAEGDILYMGRLDFQAKIQGFRVELSEVEFHAKSYLKGVNAVALAITNKSGNTEIGMAIESASFDSKSLTDYMKEKMPPYMIPSQLVFTQSMPLNSNGKIDRKQIALLFKTA